MVRVKWGGGEGIVLQWLNRTKGIIAIVKTICGPDSVSDFIEVPMEQLTFMDWVAR